jgi:dihydroorotase
MGVDADVTIFDPDKEWVFDRAESASKSFNSPFYGWTLKGKAMGTIVGGKIVWQDPALLATARADSSAAAEKLAAAK